MKKQQKEKPPPQEAQNRRALRAAQKEIERLKKLIDKRVREINKLRKNTPSPTPPLPDVKIGMKQKG